MLKPLRTRLSWVEDPASSLTVCWDMEKKSKTAGVRYRIKGAQDWQTVDAEKRPRQADGWFFRAFLRNLPANTEIEYQPIGDLGDESTAGGIQTTRTAPDGPHDPFSFVFFGDTGLIGRLDGNANGTEAVYRHICETDPLFLLGAGDYAYANRDGRFNRISDAVDEWFNQAEPMLRRFPLYAQYGNHEIQLTERFEDWCSRFSHPPGYDNDRSYSFRIADVHFSALFMPDVESAMPSHAAWLDRDLEQARQSGVRRLIVFQHEPVYGHGRSHPAWPKVRNMVAPILEKHRVDFHLSVHDQNYERTYPLLHDKDGNPVVTGEPSGGKWSGVVYAKVSPAGKMSEIGNCFSRFTVEQQSFMAKRDDTAHHWAEVRITSEDAIQVDVRRLEPGSSEISIEDSFRIG